MDRRGDGSFLMAGVHQLLIVGRYGAFPTAQDVKVSELNNPGGSSITPTMPSHNDQSEIIGFISCHGTTVPTCSAGWSISDHRTWGGTSPGGLCYIHRLKNSTSSSVTITNPNNSNIMVHLYSFSNAEKGADRASNAAGSDPPNLNAAWGPLNNCWLVAHAGGVAGNRADAVPSGFGGIAQTQEGGLSLTTARRLEAVGSMNPGAFSVMFGTGVDCAVITALVKPLS
jgi:hypothetical protein